MTSRYEGLGALSPRPPRPWPNRSCGRGHRWSMVYRPVLAIPALAFQVCTRKGCKEVKWA